jgi:hypothetical protein
VVFRHFIRYGPRAHGHMTDRPAAKIATSHLFAGQEAYSHIMTGGRKTAGSAYVGSNPTPATTCENGPGSWEFSAMRAVRFWRARRERTSPSAAFRLLQYLAPSALPGYGPLVSALTMKRHAR